MSTAEYQVALRADFICQEDDRTRVGSDNASLSEGNL